MNNVKIGDIVMTDLDNAEKMWVCSGKTYDGKLKLIQASLPNVSMVIDSEKAIRLGPWR